MIAYEVFPTFSMTLSLGGEICQMVVWYYESTYYKKLHHRDTETQRRKWNLLLGIC